MRSEIKTTIHSLLEKIDDQVFQFIKESEQVGNDRWVRRADICNKLELKFHTVPKNNTSQYNEKDWLVQIIARRLEDQDRVESKIERNKRYYRILPRGK